MIGSVIRYMNGYLLIRVEGWSPERFITICSHHHIVLWGLHSAGGSYEMYIALKDFRRIRPFSRKTGTRIRILRRFGLPFFFWKRRKRKLFFAGAVIGTAVLFFLSMFIWEIDIQGNFRTTDESVLAFLRSEEVYCGMPAGKADCTRIARTLREHYQNLVWVSASIDGTRLIIQVKENETETGKTQQEQEETGTDLAAASDCRIVSIVTRKGTPQVEVQDQVAAGTVLVSGRIDLKNDAGEITGYRYCRADADIIGEYTVPYEDTVQRAYETRTYEYDKKTRIMQEEWFLRAGPFTVGLGTIQHHYPEYEYTEEEKQLFSLPLFLGRRTCSPCTVSRQMYSDKKLQEYLSIRFQRKAGELKKKGLEIIQNDVKIYTEQNKASAKGVLVLQGPVSEPVPTEILPDPVTDDQTEREDNTDGNE